MLYYGPTWWIFVLPAVLFATYAQAKVTSAYNKYSQVSNDTGLTGHDVARMILDRNGLTDVKIQRGQGQLTDHYDPRSRIIRLSPAVYSGTTVASMSIAAHEVGHAIQHAQGYMPLKLRSAIVPLANIGSRLSFVFIMMGILFQNSFVNIGIIMFLMSVIFQVVTLPVEFNASSRALSELEQGVAPATKISQSKQVLQAAALTYVAATLVAIGELLRLLAITSNQRNRRD